MGLKVCPTQSASTILLVLLWAPNGECGNAMGFAVAICLRYKYY